MFICIMSTLMSNPCCQNGPIFMTLLLGPYSLVRHMQMINQRFCLRCVFPKSLNFFTFSYKGVASVALNPTRNESKKFQHNM